MKEIKAYIKPHKLSSVTLALRKVEGLTGMSVVDVRGFGRSRGKGERHGIADDLEDFVPHVKIEIVCRGDMAEEVVSVISEAAHTGLRGDGKIYVSSVEEAVRIENGERGGAAV
ncbi:MAG: P-II family nitrogen regulator [Candidatus Nitrospinota bacterium M3_3B_026]